MRLKDKNGTEIRAGDVIQIEDVRFFVTYVNEDFASEEAIELCKKSEIVERRRD